MDVPTDADLVDRCIGRQAGAWEDLCGRYADFVHAVARGAGLDSAAAGDVTQEVFVIFWRNLNRLRGSTRLRGWFAVVTKRRAWRVARGQSARAARERAAAREEVAEAPTPDAVVLDLERRHVVRRALRAISDRCRQLLTALFFEPERDYQQLSEQLGMAVGSIGPTRRRCLEKLRVRLADEGISAEDVSPGGPEAF